MTALESMKLLTIIAPADLQPVVVEALRERGIDGYTVVRATGSGTTGLRSGGMLPADSNVLLYIMLPEPRLASVIEGVDALTRRGHRLQAWVQDVSMLPRQAAGSSPV